MSHSTSYYDILGVRESASQGEIKSAYKRLALRYHPDKNAGSQYAEEQFKAVNEAYRTLSNPTDKLKYDESLSKERLQSFYANYTAYNKGTTRSYYQRYGKYDWRKSPRYAKAATYKIDKHYYKVQAYTMGILFCVSAMIFAGTAIHDYYEEQRLLKEKEYIDLWVSKADLHYGHHAFDSTFGIVKRLIKEFPYEMRFSQLRNEYVSKTMKMGMAYYAEKNYREAILSLDAVIRHSRRQHLEAWMVIGECHFMLKNYQKAINAFDYVSMREANNLQLTMRIGDIHLSLGEYQQALDHYTRAKSIFKSRQSNAYGKAFELVVNPEYLDTVYFHLFDVRGKLNYELGNYGEAATDYNWAIFLQPDSYVSYRKRGECYLKNGNFTRACNDLRVAYRQGDQQAKLLLEQYCNR